MLPDQLFCIILTDEAFKVDALHLNFFLLGEFSFSANMIF